MLNEVCTFLKDNDEALYNRLPELHCQTEVEDAGLPPHRALLKMIVNKRGDDSVLEKTANMWSADLESKLLNHKPVKMVGGYSEGPFFEAPAALLRRWKAELTNREYYLVLTALLYGRTVSNELSVENDGDLELQDVRITVPAPVSDMTETWKSEIMDVGTGSPRILSSYQKTSDRVEFAIPALKVGGRFSARIYTRTFPMEEAGVIRSYQPIRKINKLGAILMLLKTFSIVLIVTCVFWKSCDTKPEKLGTHDLIR